MTGIIELDAFLFGIISSVALPIGAGALLAALTTDLVAVSVEKGHFYPLAIGMVAGVIFFVLLNKIVNSKGGFLATLLFTVLGN